MAALKIRIQGQISIHKFPCQNLSCMLVVIYPKISVTETEFFFLEKTLTALAFIELVTYSRETAFISSTVENSGSQRD